MRIKSGTVWSPCKALNYTRGVFGSQWIYPSLLDRGYRILIYSGNSDTGVPTIGTHRWIYDLKLAETSEWRPYFMQTGLTTHQIAGYTESRTGGEGMGNLTFATVHGGG